MEERGEKKWKRSNNFRNECDQYNILENLRKSRIKFIRSQRVLQRHNTKRFKNLQDLGKNTLYTCVHTSLPLPLFFACRSRRPNECCWSRFRSAECCYRSRWQRWSRCYPQWKLQSFESVSLKWCILCRPSSPFWKLNVFGVLRFKASMLVHVPKVYVPCATYASCISSMLFAPLSPPN